MRRPNPACRLKLIASRHFGWLPVNVWQLVGLFDDAKSEQSCNSPFDLFHLFLCMFRLFLSFILKVVAFHYNNFHSCANILRMTQVIYQSYNRLETCNNELFWRIGFSLQSHMYISVVYIFILWRLDTSNICSILLKNFTLQNILFFRIWRSFICGLSFSGRIKCVIDIYKK